MAIWTVELSSCWTTRWFDHQSIHSRSVWLQTHDDVLHGMDDFGDFHPLLRPILIRIGLWRGHVRHSMGCLSGTSIAVD